ncbi:asparagine synthase-related protein, partial [Nonomuraea sp. NPDC004297]
MGLALDGAWFVALPDSTTNQAAAQAARLTGLPGASVLLRHATGRPCLIGALTATPVVIAQAGPVSVAVIGCCPVTAADLARLAAGVTRLDDADLLPDRLPGSYHLLVALHGAVRVQGSASGLRRVFHARLDGTAVAGDRAHVLAALTGAGLDTEQMAVHLLRFTPPALSGSLWQTVTAVPAGSAAHLEAGGTVRIRRWWQPPEPDLPIAQAAPALADALAEAVAARVPAGGVVAADLSGGLDSTPLCFLAQDAARERDARLITIRKEVDDPAHDDAAWAAKAAAHLDAEHVVTAPGELPTWFAGVAEPIAGLDEPLGAVSSLHEIRAVAALLARHGASAHLSGFGGDELTLTGDGYLHDLARIRPLALWPRLRQVRARRRWP